jgi:hypothetical protein
MFSYAQQDTIKIPTPVAKQIVKDLVSGDSAKAELKLANQHIALLNQKVSLKDNIINEHVKKGIMYEDRIKNEQIKFNTQGLFVKDLQKQNKKIQTKLTFTRIVLTAVIGGLTYLYITK